MTLRNTIPTAVLLTFAIGAAPVRADDHRDGRDRGRSEPAARRGDTRHQENADVRRGNPTPGEHAVPRAEAPPRVEPGAVTPMVTAPVKPMVVAPVAPRVEPRVIAPRVEPQVIAPRVYSPPVYAPPPAHAYPHVYPRVYPHVYPRVYPHVYPRPVYVAPAWPWFRPHFHIGFGVYLGYPVAYPYPYPYAYPVPVPVPSYTYPSASSVTVAPATAYGGVSFQITPDDAAVYVDGNYVGTVGNFYDPEHPLTLAAGSHRIDITADGYQTLTFDVNVQSGQVIPYQGALEAY